MILLYLHRCGKAVRLMKDKVSFVFWLQSTNVLGSRSTVTRETPYVADEVTQVGGDADLRTRVTVWMKKRETDTEVGKDEVSPGLGD